jgi:hypothetical protein
MEILDKTEDIQIKPKSNSNSNEEVDPAIILQEQNLQNNKLLLQILNQNAVNTCLTAKICEKLNIDLTPIIEEFKKGLKNSGK